jgi:hypothetical protein
VDDDLVGFSGQGRLKLLWVADVHLKEVKASPLGHLPQVLSLEIGRVGVVEVVQDGYPSPGANQAFSQVRADETGASGKQNRGSRRKPGRGVQ